MKKIAVLLLLPFLFSCSAIGTEKKEPLLKGFYSYMADAALFVDCETDKRYPVSFEADNISLERAYLELNKGPGERVLVTLKGRFENRPKMEGDGEREFLIVEKFDRIWPYADCNSNLGTANLRNTFWSLRELNGKLTGNYKTEKEIHFIIKQDNSIKGFFGCNNFFGKSSLSNGTLRFSEIGSTRLMCKNIDIEQGFLLALEKTNRYKIYGEFLYLYDGVNILAKFESVYFK